VYVSGSTKKDRKKHKIELKHLSFSMKYLVEDCLNENIYYSVVK